MCPCCKLNIKEKQPSFQIAFLLNVNVAFAILTVIDVVSYTLFRWYQARFDITYTGIYAAASRMCMLTFTYCKILKIT